MEKLDRLDKEILLALDRNCRLSYQTLAESLGITATAVRKRIDKMITEGVIEEFDVILKPAMLDSEYLIALIHTDGMEDEDEFIPRIGMNINVVQAGQVLTNAGRLYFVHGEYIGPKNLQDLSVFFRKLPSVISVELHTIIISRGERFVMRNLHMRVLQCLLHDARMQISEISERTGLTARRVSRVIQEMVDSDAFWFAVRWNLSLGSNTEFYLKIKYDEKTSSRNEIEEWFKNEFPLQYWYSYYSALQPILFAKFVTNHFRDAEVVSKRTKRAPFSVSVDVLLSYPVTKFPRLGRTYLTEIIERAGV